ncbi:archaeosine synthase subunit alpha [Halorubellus sp. PRR65]|uniref:archaeosine synthase subunit alpha n=1 Tax=Halorubellus sp. PRR65 TaxID=3098148 RepID=UPI002B25C9ED|nr:archaeosine synthase subunit alpha [Halorubellus sp. PRR65]
MTEYFEVLSRDGAARAAELRLADPVATPALVDDVVENAGGMWPEHRDVPDGDDSALTVLPHRGLPAGTADEVADSFAVSAPDVDHPSAAVVNSNHVEDCGADAYVLSDVQGFLGHARGLKDAILSVKAAVPEDAAVYLSGAATPRNVAVLAYAGVDLFDADRAVALGTQGRYLTTDENHFLEDLDELPCACEACRQPREDFDRSDCADHNVAVLEAELARVRRRIRDGRLRDYVEGQARQDQWLTALVRELDQEWGYLEARTPVYRNAHMDATTEDTLNRVEIQRYAQRVTERYRNRFDAPLVLVPCSATKPYSESQSHYQFREVIGYRAHLASITSPIGVVPQELELTYPAQHYDTVVTGEWTAGEVEFVAEVLRRYLDANDYPRVVAHVPDDYRPIVDRALDAHPDLDVEFTVADHPTTDESLANLAAALDGESAYGKRERQRNTVRALADYQFGDGAGDDLFGEFRVTSRYPKLQVRADEPPTAGDDQNAAPQLATMVPNYGTLSFTLRGARRWLASDVPTKTVEIDAFVPHGSVLAPGVVDADSDIREGDEVVVEGPKAFAVGRAQMHGDAMVESTRGEACSVRHVEET